MADWNGLIAPATAVVATFTDYADGKIILAGDSIHKNRRSRTSSQKKLIEDSGVKLLDFTDQKLKAFIEKEFKFRREMEEKN